MADFRLGRLKFKWRGDWTASTAYVIDDIVKYGANTYVCISNHTSSSDESQFYADTGANKWDLQGEGIVNKGDWAASTWYKINDVVKYGNIQYRTVSGHSSQATFDTTKFVVYVEGLKFEDTWTANNPYQIGDVVTYRGYSYISKTIHTSSSSPNADTTNWDVITTGFSAQGEYDASTAYAPGDVVRYGGNTYVNKVTSTGVAPITTANWTLLNEGFNWTGAWDSATVYQLGDVVNRNSNSYVCKTSNTTGASTAPELDPGGTYWNYLAQGASAAQVLQETGDMLYQAASGVNRIAMPDGAATSNAAATTHTATNASFSPTTGDLTITVANHGFSVGDFVKLDDSSITFTCDLDNNASNHAYPRATDPASGKFLPITIASTNDFTINVGVSSDTSTHSFVSAVADGITKLGNITEERKASGQVLSIGGSPLLPRWEHNNVTGNVYYVAKEGSNANHGKNISRAFGSLRYACDHIGGLTGADAPSETNPITIFVKAGQYKETLPIVVPENVSIIGDNLRTSIVEPDQGDSNLQALVLASNVTHLRFGETVWNHDKTKSAMVLDSDYTNNVHLMNLSGGAWTTGDKYHDIVDNKHADASDFLTANKTFIAWEAYHRHVASVGAVSGTESAVKLALANFVTAIAYNVKHGANNEVWDYCNARIGGAAITGDNVQDTALGNYVETIAIEVVRNLVVAVSAGNTQTQTRDLTVTSDSASPSCATVASAITTLNGIFTTSVANDDMTSTTKTDPFIDISTIATRSNAESTMCYLGSHTTIKEMVFQGMSGFVPGGNDKDMDTSTIKGVFFRFNPNSAITKSPYIQNTTIFAGAAVGVYLDGAVHNHFNNSSTPSYKSMVFDSYTQVLDGGVGFYVTNAAATEIVSSFTYYAHISYTATRGGRIRAVTGNSSYGKYGAIARGFDSSETTIDGKVKGKRLTITTTTPVSGLQVGERLVGATSGAIGELINDQAASGFLYYFPVKGTFTQGEVVTGQTTSVTATLVNNTDAVQGQKGFILTVTGLTTGPDAGGSVEMQDDGVNNDSGSFVISNASYTAPDGRGSLTVERGKLGSAAATHDGASTVSLFADAGTSATLQAAVQSNAASPVTMQVNTVTGMTIGGHLAINNELFTIASFPSATSVEANRAQEGTSAGAHSANDPIAILNTKVTSQDEIIEDVAVNDLTVRVAAANIGLDANDYIKIDDEFFKLTAVVPDTTGICTLQMADEKVIEAGDGQDFKIRYRYSQVRLTAHDFLDVGTGSKANTNWPGLPLSPNVPSQETDEDRPGRVYYVSTDQDGNFSVGKFFRVEQATGKATLDASAFDLSGLSSLRLGSIGAQLGASINEFSTDATLSQNSDNKVATQKATKTYVDNLSAIAGNLTIGGNLTIKGTTTSINSVTLTSKDRNIELGKVDVGNFTGDVTAGSADITNVSDTDNIAPGVAITLSSGGGTVTLASGGIVTAVVGTTVTLDQVFQGTGSASAATFATGGATDATGNGGGVTVLGTTNKTIAWQSSNDKFNFNKGIELASGENFTINGTDVLSETTMMGKTVITDLANADHTQFATAGAVKLYVDNPNNSMSYFLATMS